MIALTLYPVFKSNLSLLSATLSSLFSHNYRNLFWLPSRTPSFPTRYAWINLDQANPHPYPCPHFHISKQIYITHPVLTHTFEIFMPMSITPRTHSVKLHQLYNLWPSTARFSPVIPICQWNASSAAPHVTLPCMNKDTQQQRQPTSFSLADELFVWCPAAKKHVCLPQWLQMAQPHLNKPKLKNQTLNDSHQWAGFFVCGSIVQISNNINEQHCVVSGVFNMLSWCEILS